MHVCMYVFYSGRNEIWTGIAGFRVLSANHHTMYPPCMHACMYVYVYVCVGGGGGGGGGFYILNNASNKFIGFLFKYYTIFIVIVISFHIFLPQ